MPDSDVAFLNALGVIRGNIQEKINFAGELPTRFSRKRYEKGASSAPGFHSAHDVGAIAACREGYKDIVMRDQGFNLTGKDSFESVVVACRGQN